MNIESISISNDIPNGIPGVYLLNPCRKNDRIRIKTTPNLRFVIDKRTTGKPIITPRNTNPDFTPNSTIESGTIMAIIKRMT